MLLDKPPVLQGRLADYYFISTVESKPIIMFSDGIWRVPRRPPAVARQGQNTNAASAPAKSLQPAVQPHVHSVSDYK